MVDVTLYLPVYTNSLLTNLNARKIIRDAGEIRTSVNFPPSLQEGSSGVNDSGTRFYARAPD